MSTIIVATNGSGLYSREVSANDTTVYSDKEVAEFNTMKDANLFMDENDHNYYEDDQ